MSRVRLVPIVVILLITLGILFGGWQAYRQFQLVQPLQTKIGKIQGVETVEFEPGNSSVIQVHLGGFNTLVNGDLQQTYKAILKQIVGTLGTGESITIFDHSNAKLTNAFENYQPALQEGLVKGNYQEMISSLTAKANASGIHAVITMDDTHVYVQLADGPYYLYYIRSLPSVQGGASS